ncbi:MAG: CHAT domain-containing protein [Egibacteraceae bacterium]
MGAGLSFELEVGFGAGGMYPVAARAPGGGEAAATMRLPLEDFDRQLAAVKDAVLASSAIVRRIPTLDEQPVQQLGRALFDALFTDDVRALFGASYQQARQQDADLRLVLRIQPPELARLPWEFLFDPGRGEYVGLRLPLVRYPQVMEPTRPLPVPPPLRILGMVALPGDRDALDVEGEQRRLHEALAALERDGRVELCWVRGQTWRDLQRAMDDDTWHVLHFIGHGGFDHRTDEGIIALADEHGRTSFLGASDLSLLLSDHRRLRLVVLNACDTGRASALGAFSSTAGSLIRGGIPAVVAMQFEMGAALLK